MPAQIPFLSIAVSPATEEKSTMIMSTPGAMPPSILPRTVPVNSWGSVPRTTVFVVTVAPSPSSSEAKSSMAKVVSQLPGSAEAGVATTDAAPPSNVRLATNAAAPRLREVVMFIGVSPSPR